VAEKYDLVVLGGGPGGYPAAVRAAQLGLNVALVEADKLGGECTNYGCIPTKALIRAAEALHAASLPFIRGGVSADFGELMEWVKGFSSRISGGVEFLLKGYGVQVYRGHGSIHAPGVLSVDGEMVRFEKLIVATGTSPAEIPGLEPDGEIVHDNRSILGLKRKPSRMLIVGGGYIGVEYAAAMAKLGVEVHIVELLDRLLPGMDRDFGRIVERHLKKLGVKVYTRTRVEGLERREAYAVARLSGNKSVEADTVLVAVGRRPNTSGIGLEKLGVILDDKGYVKVNERMEARGAPGVYAAGDVTGPPLLAHKAFLQAVVAAESASGDRSAAYDPRGVPSVVFTDPEIASVGLTLEEARRLGLKAAERRLPLGGLARASLEGCGDCFAKIVYDEDSKALLGFHIAAPNASEIIAAAALAIEMGATLEDVALTIHPHPTVSEALKEAAELALGRPIHFLLKR